MDKSADANNIENNNNNCPDDYNKNNNNDVDCFPRQDKQPVLPQDISPTAPTANNHPLSSIESSTDKSIQCTTPTRTKRSAYRGFITKPTHTVVPKAPLLVWDDTQYHQRLQP